MEINEQERILHGFLSRWPDDSIKKLTLQDYVGLGNKDTFCQWIETKTIMLGSIKGWSSIKFGIYERKEITKKPKNYINDNKYSWLRSYGKNRKLAFEKIKRDIINIIKLSEVGKFEKIDDISLPDLFKWKIAFLYSNERLIPIFKKEVLIKIANNFGLEADKKTKISEIQNVMMLNKPTNLNVYEFMGNLYEKFGSKKEKREIARISKQNRKKRITRKAASKKSTNTQTRTMNHSYKAEQKHNKIQQALCSLLRKEYGNENVILEENYVDIKVIQPDKITFYEVKSSSYASDCIKEALGQILLYSLNDKDSRPKKLIIVGQYPANDNDNEYINFLKKNIKIELDYINVKIE